MGAWHETYRNWTGTVEELAAEVDRLVPRLGLPEGTASAPGVRLIRHYLTVGALTRPVRSSRSAYFDGRAVLEVLAVRLLLAQGWPLAKIADLLRTLDRDRLAGMLPATLREPGDAAEARPRAGNAAQDLVRQFEARRPGHGSRRMASAPGAPSFAAAEPSPPASPAPRPAAPEAPPPAPPSPAAPSAAALVQMFGASTQESLALESDLSALGNPAGVPGRREMVRLTVAPWCDVEVDRAALASLTPDLAARAGDALRRLLTKEARRHGGRP